MLASERRPPYHPDDQPDGTTSDQITHIDAGLRLSSAGPREWGICTEYGSTISLAGRLTGSR